MPRDAAVVKSQFHPLPAGVGGAGLAADDIILEATQRGGLCWLEAEELARRTAELQVPVVARRQFPLLVIIAIPVIVAGTATLVACVAPLAGALTPFRPASGVEGQHRWAARVARLPISGQILGLVPLGAGMILGGIIGLVRAPRATEPME